jgi:hypothetical protein
MFDDAVGVLDVAKKKMTLKATGAKPPAKGPASGPESWTRKPLIANFRGSAEFKAWLQRLAVADRQSVAGVIERALVHYARDVVKFKEEAPER